MAGEIKCFFFSEFDPVAGPKITYQVPEDFAMREAFDAVHDLIITKPNLYNRIISVYERMYLYIYTSMCSLKLFKRFSLYRDVSGYRIVGCPRCIEDKKYARNAFIFNFVFVFASSTTSSPYESIITKIGDTFRTCELESSFLSDPTKRCKLPQAMAAVMNGLNNCGLCTINIDDTNCLYLKLTPSLQEPPEVQDYHVPIFICSKEDIRATSDLTIEQTGDPNVKLGRHCSNEVVARSLELQAGETNLILPYINGFNHVQKIATLSEVDIGLVKQCIQHLVVYSFLKLISIFQYSNVYVALPEIHKLLNDTNLQRECLDYVAVPGAGPTVGDVFRLYCSLEAGQTVRDLCMMQDLRAMNVDERLLIQYGLMRNLIHHLQKYPVLISTARENETLPSSLQPLRKYLDGSHCCDEICCCLGVSSQRLDDLLESCQNIAVCWK